MFGCHNCPHAGVNFESYEKSPCSICRTKNDPPPISGIPVESVMYSEEYSAQPELCDGGESSNIDINAVFCAMGRCLRTLVSMKENYPETYSILITKIDRPFLSYSELADMHKCRKQNIQYHLKKAVDICPELVHALIIDSRFSGSRGPGVKRRRATGKIKMLKEKGAA